MVSFVRKGPLFPRKTNLMHEKSHYTCSHWPKFDWRFRWMLVTSREIVEARVSQWGAQKISLHSLQQPGGQDPGCAARAARWVPESILVVVYDDFCVSGTRIGQASECFVYWKDPSTSDTWGLNFTSPIDAKQFRECCVSIHVIS